MIQVIENIKILASKEQRKLTSQENASALELEQKKSKEQKKIQYVEYQKIE